MPEIAWVENSTFSILKSDWLERWNAKRTEDFTKQSEDEEMKLCAILVEFERSQNKRIQMQLLKPDNDSLAGQLEVI